MIRSPEDIAIRQATIADLDLLVPLFDAYRRFYGQPGDLPRARAFLGERFQHDQSVVFLALGADGAAIGFTQLYPSFSSVSVSRLFILNDLFVAPEARRAGAGARLLQAAAAYGRAAGATRLALSTAVDNHAAQRLYAAQGWKRDDQYHVYNLALTA